MMTFDPELHVLYYCESHFHDLTMAVLELALPSRCILSTVEFVLTA